MWSLPDIKRLNDEAADAANRRQLEKDAEHPQDHSCTVCEWNGEEKPADYSYLTYDIFSDDPKGVIFTCENHDRSTGEPIEGYFECGDCLKVLAENYTWERYDIIVGCERLCLPCALWRYLDDKEHWINPEGVEQVVLDPHSHEEDGWNRVLDPQTGVLNLAACPHLIAVKQPLPDDLHFVENLEFDSSTGPLLAGFSSTYAEGVGENAALRKIRELAEAGYTEFIPILDGAYQFSVSIGLYVKADVHQTIEERGASSALSPSR